MAPRLMRDSTGRRLRRPNSWTAPVALLLAAVTVLLGVRAAQVLHAASQPLPYAVEVVIEGEQDYNITAATVAAELEANPVRSSQPITLVLTDRWLTGDELLRGQVPEHRILISSRLENLDTDDYGIEQRFAGAAVARNLAGSDDEHTDARYDIAQAFTKNVSVGHGPKAVVAAAHTAAVLLDNSPSQSAIFWFAVVGLSAMLTAAAAAHALRFRSRWEARYRRLSAAQHRLARVVLDLEALEATYLATPAARRPAGFTRAWQTLQDSSLDAARREDPLVQDLFNRKSCLSKQTGQKLGAFEADTRTLAGLSEGLMGAGSVHARLAGTGSTFDALSRPLNDAVTELLIRLDRAPGQVVAPGDTQKLRMLLGQLLDAAGDGSQERPAIKRWAAAEAQLAKQARRISGRLSRYPMGERPPTLPLSTAQDQLRTSLGLSAATTRGALHQIQQANQLARAVLGDTLAQDQAAVQQRKPGKFLRILSLLLPGGAEPRPVHRWWLAGGLGALLVASLVAAGLVVTPLADTPRATHDGSGQGMDLQIDDAAGLLDEAEIRRYMDEDFDSMQQVLVAVRDAEEYLDFTVAEGSDYRDATVDSVRTAIWRIKSEFSERQNPANGELPEDLTIIPLLITDEGRGIMPGLISGAVIGGTASWGSTTTWDYGSIHESRYPAMEAANAAQDFATVLKRAGYQEPDFNPVLLYWILVFMFFFTVLNLAQLAQGLLGATSRLTRFSRGSQRLRRVQRELQRLALGLEDSQINAVAVLGARESGRADEAGQRLFERAVALAWREAQELSLLPLGQRLAPAYTRRTERLEALVALLGDRDDDVARRARALLRASHGEQPMA